MNAIGGLKTCSRCTTELPVSEFYRNRAQSDGLDNLCKVCGRAARSVSKRKHPETVRAYCKRWRERHPVQDRARQSKWTKQNALHVSVYNEQVRQKMKKAPGRGVTLVQWKDVLTVWGSRCAYCGVETTAMDHFVPISRGGAHDVNNVMPACKSCNSAKKNREPLAWLATRGIDPAPLFLNLLKASMGFA